MRRLSFDQYEFDSTDSEESIELAISSPNQHPDLRSLLSECAASGLTGPSIPPGWHQSDYVVSELKRLIGLELPHPSQWRESVLLQDEWNEFELGIAAGPILLWFKWNTSA